MAPCYAPNMRFSDPVNPAGATFRFENARIADHRDDFDCKGWACERLGFAGVLPPVRRAVAGAYASVRTSS